jgi:hypothetical protein
MNLFKSCVLLALASTVGGCTFLSDKLKATVEESTKISTYCNSQTITALAKSTSFEHAISEQVATVMLVGLGGTPDDLKSSLTQGLASVESDFSALARKIRPTADADMKKRLDTLRSDLRSIRQHAEALRATVISSAKTALGYRQIAYHQAVADFSSLVTNVSANVRGELASLESDFQKTIDDLSDLTDDLQRAGKIAGDDLQNLTASVKAAAILIQISWRKVDNALKGQFSVTDGSSPAADAALREALQKLVERVVVYEGARLTLLGLNKAARSIEYKLDEVDNRTWFILTLAQFTFGDDLSKSIAEYIVEKLKIKRDNVPPALGLSFASGSSQPPTPLTTLQKKLLSEALFVAACDRLMTDSSNFPSNTVRAEQLLHPLYVAFVEAYIELNSSNRLTREQPIAAAVHQSTQERLADYKATAAEIRNARSTLTDKIVTAYNLEIERKAAVPAAAPPPPLVRPGNQPLARPNLRLPEFSLETTQRRLADRSRSAQPLVDRDAIDSVLKIN